MPLAISPLSKISASLPTKNCNFLAQYISPRFLIFQVVLLSILLIIIVTMSLYLTASRDNAGVDGDFLVS